MNQFEKMIAELGRNVVRPRNGFVEIRHRCSSCKKSFPVDFPDLMSLRQVKICGCMFCGKTHRVVFDNRDAKETCHE